MLLQFTLLQFLINKNINPQLQSKVLSFIPNTAEAISLINLNLKKIRPILRRKNITPEELVFIKDTVLNLEEKRKQLLFYANAEEFITYNYYFCYDVNAFVNCFFPSTLNLEPEIRELLNSFVLENQLSSSVRALKYRSVVKSGLRSKHLSDIIKISLKSSLEALPSTKICLKSAVAEVLSNSKPINILDYKKPLFEASKPFSV